MHIVIGDGGNREGLADTYDEPQPEWSAYREASFGSGTLDLLNVTHALWRWHRNQDTQAVVSDEVGGGASLSEPAPLEGVACSLCLAGDIESALRAGLIPEREGSTWAPHRLGACFADLAGAQLQLPSKWGSTAWAVAE